MELYQESSRVMPHSPGQIRILSTTSRVGSGRVWSGRVGSGRVGSGRVGSGRVGSGRVGSGWVGLGRVGSGQEVSRYHGSGPGRPDPF